MNLDELQSVQSRERQIDSLQQLHDTFYQDAGRFVRQLREERESVAERAADPFDSPDVQRLTNEINTAERTVESIYERRIGKLVKQASLDAAGMAADVDGLTSEERETFDRLVATIEDSRSRVLDTVLAQEAAAETAPPSDDEDSAGPSEAKASASELRASSAMGSGEDVTTDRETPQPPPDEPLETESAPVQEVDEPTAPQPPDETPTAGEDTDDVERMTVRITSDVGEILGVDDRAYELSTDDVVRLPTMNADPLLEQDAAIQLDQS
ncbi:hypothetical protein [Halocatena halophila]|uniref:hypothetical protein n=1 Tax=Halocatena halophila TaxID=2814576 RepID=UPI002ED1D12F